MITYWNWIQKKYVDNSNKDNSVQKMGSTLNKLINKIRNFGVIKKFLGVFVHIFQHSILSKNK